MRKGSFGFLVAMFLTLLCVTPLSAEQKIETIKVLVLEKGKSPIVEATGGYRIFDPADQRTIGGGMRGKRFALEAMNTGLKWGEQYPAVYQITIEPRRAGSTLIVDGVEYGGKIHAYQVGDQVNLVNEVPIDDYLKITLAHEFKEPLAAEVMAAVTIAARTNAYYMVEAGHRSYWHVRAKDVGYEGGLKSLRQGAIDQAVEETRDMVGLRAGRPFPAVWTGHCGGKTCAYQLMFRQCEGENGMGVEAPFAAKGRELSAWKVAIPKEWLARAACLEDISSMSLYADQKSQKVYAVRLSDGGRTADLNFFKLQEALGANRLRSSDFTAEVAGDEVIFSGYGVGHGVGLCLYSASQMAKQGKNAAQILEAFYPQMEIEIAGAPLLGSPSGNLSAVSRYSQRHLKDS